MALLTQWRWVWANSGSWWWTGRPGVLQTMASQRVRHDWVTELNWTELKENNKYLGSWTWIKFVFILWGCCYFPFLKFAILWKFQFSSVTQSCSTLCNPMDCSTPGLPVHRHLLAFTQTHVHCVGDAIQPSHPLSSPSSPAFNLSQHQGLFQWVSSLHEVAKALEFQL